MELFAFVKTCRVALCFPVVVSIKHLLNGNKALRFLWLKESFCFVGSRIGKINSLLFVSVVL